MEINLIDNEQGHLLLIALMSCLPSQSWFSLKSCEGSELKESIVAGVNLPSGTVYFMVPSEYRELLLKSGASYLPLSYKSPEKSRGAVIGSLTSFIGR